jgi:hypothetical protein
LPPTFARSSEVWHRLLPEAEVVDVEEPDEVEVDVDVESEPVAVSVPLDEVTGVPDPSVEGSPPAGAAVPDWVCGLLTVPLPSPQAVVRPSTATALTSSAARRRDGDVFAIFDTPGSSPHSASRAVTVVRCACAPKGSRDRRSFFRQRLRQ